MNKYKALRERSFKGQNFLCLMAIPAAALGLPHMEMGRGLAERYGSGTALSSIVVGNLFLWVVAMGVIAMMESTHIDAIENIKKYLGKWGGRCAAFCFLVAFLGGYAFDIDALVGLVRSEFGWSTGMTLRVGAVLGLLGALLAIGGLRVLKLVAFVGFPLFFVYQIYGMIVSESVVWEGTWGVSFPAVLQTMFISFPFVIMFPTLFRYSKSNEHSYLGLGLFALMVMFFQASTIWCDLRMLQPVWVVLVGFVVLKAVCCNLFQIYLASACWEAIVPKLTTAKEFTIIGLIGTLVYTFVQVSDPVLFLQDIMAGYVGSIGVVLLIGYLVRVMIRHRPRPLEKGINVAAWAFGALIVTIHEVRYFPHHISGVVMAVSGSFLFFLSILFIEETVWAARAKWQQIIRKS